MFKIFGVSDSQDRSPDMDLEIIDTKEEIISEDVGQIALDVLETEDEIYIIAPIAGVEQESIDITINKTILTMKGTREKPQEYSIEGIKTLNTEVFFGKFIRNIILPENLALNKIKAYMENNLLIVSIPKLKFDSKAIKINKIES